MYGESTFCLFGLRPKTVRPKIVTSVEIKLWLFCHKLAEGNFLHGIKNKKPRFKKWLKISKSETSTGDSKTR